MPDTSIADFYTRHFDSDGLNGKSWQDGRKSHEAFVMSIEASLERTGMWSTTGEYRMGGYINVAIEAVQVGDNAIAGGDFVTPDTVAYRVTAECGITVSAEYLSLEEALGTLMVFVAFAWGRPVPSVGAWSRS